ncbi:DNA-binding transcriptional regulator, LacI/PurR family [Tropicimonas sediminicola]|uniref:DNA-binding transcriptional regulator, LacI/PurR family n=2 Tax=Tropicimonas sediminicola TaxID=1031541 RepID=A0A239J819_9RHOB|nr:DNA-binding transcriptional regulator, LacI/PurR family [Tropicimonas sediminicola]
MISLVVGDITNPFYPTILERFATEFAAVGYDLLVHTVPKDATVDSVMPQVFRVQSDAVVVTSANMSSRLARECQARGIPVVLFNRVQADASLSAVCADNYNGGRVIAEHLKNKGCERLAFIGGIKDTSTHLERRRGFYDALEGAGLDVAYEGTGNYDYTKSLEFADLLFRDARRPDGVFCANDITAIAAIDSAKSAGLLPGKDVAIVGFDDVPMASWSSYRLTTVRQKIGAMIRNTLGLIEDSLADPDSAGTVRMIRGELIVRDSG